MSTFNFDVDEHKCIASKFSRVRTKFPMNFENCIILSCFAKVWNSVPRSEEFCYSTCWNSTFEANTMLCWIWISMFRAIFSRVTIVSLLVCATVSVLYANPDMCPALGTSCSRLLHERYTQTHGEAKYTFESSREHPGAAFRSEFFDISKKKKYHSKP